MDRRMLLVGLTVLLLFYRRGSAEVEYTYSKEVLAWPEVVVRWTDKGVIQDLWDTGIQPWIRFSSRPDDLRFKRVRLCLQMPNNVLTPLLPVEEANVVLPGRQRSTRLLFYTPPLTLREARVEAVKWLPFGPVSEFDLDVYLSSVKASLIPGQYKIPKGPQFTIQWRDSNNVVYYLDLVREANLDTPLRLVFQFEIPPETVAEDVEKEVHGFTPPPGYEKIKLNTQETVLDHTDIPVSTEPRPRKGGIPIHSPTWINDMDDLIVALKRGGKWLWFVLLLGGLAIAWLRRKKPHPGCE